MMVRVVRVDSLPCGLSIFVDDQLDSLVVWVLEQDFPPMAASMLQAALNATAWYWMRKDAPVQPILRTV